MMSTIPARHQSLPDGEPKRRTRVLCAHCAGEVSDLGRTRCDHGRRIVRFHRGR